MCATDRPSYFVSESLCANVHIGVLDFFRLSFALLDTESAGRVHYLFGVCLIAGLPGEVQVTELNGETLWTSAFLTQEGFAVQHDRGEQALSGVIYSGNGFDVFACPRIHGTISMGHIVREHSRQNIDPARLKEVGLKPGSWLRTVKDESIADDELIEAGGSTLRVGDLRGWLTVIQPGNSIACLTDFLLENPAAEDRLVRMLDGCGTLVCENSYADADAELAPRNYHLTSSDVARLTNRVQPERLVLFHLSDRYPADGWREQLHEVRQHFPAAEFPESWPVGE